MQTTPNRRDLVQLDMSEPGKGKPGPTALFLVLSPFEFNKRTGLLIVLPVASGPSVATNPFAFAIEARAPAQDEQQLFVMTHHPMTLEWRSRLARKEQAKVSEADLTEIGERLNQIIDIGVYVEKGSE